MVDEHEVFERRVRERAFHLWQEAGCPPDAAQDFWYRAHASELDALNLTPQQLEQEENAQISDAADFA